MLKKIKKQSSINRNKIKIKYLGKLKKEMLQQVKIKLIKEVKAKVKFIEN